MSCALSSPFPVSCRLAGAVLACAWLLVAGCGGKNTTKPVEPGTGAVGLTLAATGGDPVPAGDSLDVVLTLANGTGDAVCALSVQMPVPDGLTLLDTESGPAIAVDSLTVPAGKSWTLRMRLRVDPRYPGGWTVGLRASATYDTTCGDTTSRVTLLSDDPGTPAPADSTRFPVQNGGATFSVGAPGVPEVYLAGTFNNWTELDPATRMFLAPDGATRGIAVQTSGRYAYKFILYDPVTRARDWIADPRCLRAEDDGYGGMNSVGGLALPKVPTALSEPVDPSRLVIYELFTYDFSPQGTFRAVADGITGGAPDLVDLGVNAIELLPVTAANGHFNWGYEPQLLFCPDPDYGSPEDFANLVDTAHRYGIAVILDMVFNHTGPYSPLEVLDRRGTSGTYIDYDQGKIFGMYQLNWASPTVRRLLLDAALFWVERYGVDGFRMDAVDPADYDGYTWWRNQLKARHPETLLIGEDFNYPPNNSVTVCGFDAQWGGQHDDQWGGIANNFQNVVMALLKESPYSGRAWYPPRGSFQARDNPMWALANVISTAQGYPSYLNELKYIVSHDERRVVEEVDHRGAPEAMAIGGKVKTRLGATVLLTSPGIPMFYMGEEIAADNFIPDNPAPNKLDWVAADPGVRDTYRNLIHLRLSRTSLAAEGVAFFGPDWSTNQGSYQQMKLINYWRYAGTAPESAEVVVAANFDHASHDMTAVFPDTLGWLQYDPESNGLTPVELSGDSLRITLPASSAWIYLKSASAP
jgi:1,4-alpha-glucan branching enzyme